MLLRPNRADQAFAEFVGVSILVIAVVGSGAMATTLSRDTGVQLLINALATVLALGVLIALFASVSGAHFNPVVTLGELLAKRISAISAFLYVMAQLIGGFVGVVLANLMFNHPAIFPATRIRSGANLFLGEVVATAGLVLVIHILTVQRRGNLAAILVPAWIGAAYFFTSSTSFANPAVTFARALSNTFSGIAMQSVPLFILAQIAGAAIGALGAKGLVHER